ncbi:MAG TPA: hypothetical protein VGK81_00175, partial [Anaerolineae bacterium]
KYVVIGSIVVAILVVALIGAFVYQQFVYAPNRAVAVVSGEPISVTQVQSAEKLGFANLQYSYSQLASAVQQLQQSNSQDSSFLLQYYQQQLQQVVSQASTDTIARSALQSLVDQKLIRMETSRRGITVTQAEIQHEFQYALGYYSPTLTPFPTYTPFTPEPTLTPTVTATPVATAKAITTTQAVTPTATQGPLPTATQRVQPTSISIADLEQGQKNGEDYYKNLGLSAADFLRAYETSLLTTKLKDVIAKEVPTMTQHYKFDYVRFNDVATATQYLKLLSTQQITFEAMISQANTITQPVPIGYGGNNDWTSKASVTTQFGDEAVAQLESAALNKPTGVITSQLTGGYFILLPLGREVREMNSSDLSQAQSNAYTDWLSAARADTNKVQNLIDPVSIMPGALRNDITTFQQNYGQSPTTGN